MVCTILIASALSLSPVAKPVYHTVQFFDAKIRVSERVLDRSICPEIDRVQPLEISGWDTLPEEQKQMRLDNMKKRRESQRDALVQHCKKRVGQKDANECNLN
jgi:hypothetical protein